MSGRAGVRRLRPADGVVLEMRAEYGLRCLQRAFRAFTDAGSSLTCVRVRAAISSARGAVRAAGYRARRPVEPELVKMPDGTIRAVMPRRR